MFSAPLLATMSPKVLVRLTLAAQLNMSNIDKSADLLNAQVTNIV